MNGATVATDDHVILNPSIAQRYGIFMHTMPIETTDFEILFDLSVSILGSTWQDTNHVRLGYISRQVTDGPSGSRDSGFALW